MRLVLEMYSLLFIFTIIELSVTTPENYGPYKGDWLKYETCKGPKKGDCGTVRVENTHNMSDVIYILDIAQDCPITKAKVVISSIQNKGNRANKLWNYRLDKPCQHFVLGPILVNSFKLNSRCKVNKGHYEVHVNMDEISNKFLGSSFFYGSYSFKIFAFNDNYNFFCQLAVLEIKQN